MKGKNSNGERRRGGIESRRRKMEERKIKRKMQKEKKIKEMMFKEAVKNIYKKKKAKSPFSRVASMSHEMALRSSGGSAELRTGDSLHLPQISHYRRHKCDACYVL
jgi:hypothetical protein